MTGYLQNLVHRAVDDSRHLRPRLPSHFEPIVPRLAPAATVDVADTGEARPQRGQEADEPRPSSAHKDTLHVPSVPEGRINSRQSEPLRDSSLTTEATITRRGVNQPLASVDGTKNQTDATVSFEHKAATIDKGTRFPTRTEAPTAKLLTQPLDISVLVPLSPERRTPTGSRSQLADPTSRFQRTEPDGSLAGLDAEENKTRSPSQIISHRPQAESLQSWPTDPSADEDSIQTEKRFDIPAVVHDTAPPTSSLDLKTISERDADVRFLLAELRNPSTERRTGSADLKPGVLQPTMPQPQQIRSMDNDARAPQQTVNVTIGRIEIKAVATNDTPRSRRRERPAVMSLDEYLSHHAQEGSK